MHYHYVDSVEQFLDIVGIDQIDTNAKLQHFIEGTRDINQETAGMFLPRDFDGISYRFGCALAMALNNPNKHTTLDIWQHLADYLRINYKDKLINWFTYRVSDRYQYDATIGALRYGSTITNELILIRYGDLDIHNSNVELLPNKILVIDCFVDKAIFRFKTGNDVYILNNIYTWQKPDHRRDMINVLYSLLTVVGNY